MARPLMTIVNRPSMAKASNSSSMITPPDKNLNIELDMDVEVLSRPSPDRVAPKCA